MDSNEARSRLRLFAEKAEKLGRSGFLRSVLERGGTAFTINFDRTPGAKIATAFSGPGEDEVDSFVLTYRFFLQDKDAGIRATFEALSTVSTNAEILKRFSEVREELNTFLSSQLGIEVNGRVPTRREVLDTVIYGALAHEDAKYRSAARLWLGNPFLSGLVRVEFVDTLARSYAAIRELARVVGEAMKPNAEAAASGDR